MKVGKVTNLQRILRMEQLSTSQNPGGVGKLHDVGIKPTALVKGMVDQTTMAPKPCSSLLQETLYIPSYSSQ